MPKANETVLEINLTALQQNYNYLKSKLQPNTKFLAVVKAFAYGNDAEAIAKHLETLGADYFAVAYTSEGIALRKAGIKTPILVLHPQAVNFKTLLEYRLEPSLYSLKILEEFIALTSAENMQNYPIHLKFNTGLNRLGFTDEAINAIAKILENNDAVVVKSAFSHLVASEDLNEKVFTQNQIKKFTSISHNVIDALGYKPIFHLCNTSGILNYPEAHFDMVRSGIGLYGFGNSAKENQNFTPIGTLKTVISQIHTIKKGASVGYNRAHIAATDMKTATLPIGHADGIGRQYGKGKGFVVINNQKAPIVGNVCMDMIMVDVTNITCNEGDEAIIFDQTHTAEALAEGAKTISYEIITAISQRVKRRYLK
ncbi:alanine racemase [Tamlana nanhaiensis]|uniref:Alanine racemase n=1 Tax=Neotamlana nanhaiensis TaxID=1382798 RepID=A0A0D7W4H8_9FLAO|nr:alanine racemase [Tamlana nanhaiensis]KJD34011.1 alanine racemase [Tamlana nanhaiensis]